MERRTFLGLLAVGVASLAAGGAAVDPASTSRHDVRAAAPPTTVPTPTATPTPTPSAVHAVFTPTGPGPYEPPTVLSRAPGVTRDIALTVDDGYDAETVAAYVQFATDTGIHLTFSPNGVYAREWAPHADVLRPLIEAGQVQIGNHTYSHLDLKTLSDARLTEEIERNEEWINTTFGTSAMPYLRPPFGFYDDRVNELAARSGFHSILMWNGSLGDSRLLTQAVLLQQANLYVQPGTVLLGHANHPTVTECYPQLVELIRQRDLTPVTLDEMFGTSRPV